MCWAVRYGTTMQFLRYALMSPLSGGLSYRLSCPCRSLGGARGQRLLLYSPAWIHGYISLENKMF